jgi:type IV pilus assembly protein PilC
MPTPLGSQPAPQQPDSNKNNASQQPSGDNQAPLHTPAQSSQAPQPGAPLANNQQTPQQPLQADQTNQTAPSIPTIEKTPVTPAAITPVTPAPEPVAQTQNTTAQSVPNIIPPTPAPTTNIPAPSPQATTGVPTLIGNQNTQPQTEASSMASTDDTQTAVKQAEATVATPTNNTDITESKTPKKGLIETYIPSVAKLINLFKKKKTQPNTLAQQVEEKKVQMRSKKPSFMQNFVSFFKKPVQAIASVELDGTLKLSGSKERGIIERLFTFLVTKKDKLFFLDQLSTLISSDINLIDGLRLLKQQSNKRAVKRLLDHMIKDIEAGSVLSQSMMKYPRVFPRMWIHLIKAGEESGQLAVILKKLNEQQTEQARLMGGIKGALVYPCFIVLMMIVLTVVMMTTIVPQIQQIYEQASVDLPLPTQIIIMLSEFVVTSGALFAAAVVGVIMLIITGIKKVYFMGKIWDWLNLRWPVFGDLNKKRNLILFADNVQLLLGSGILLTDALTIAADIVPSVGYKEEILLIKTKIMKGENMSKAMGLIDVAREKFEPNFFFPLEFAQMINVGEQTGNTNAVLDKVKNTYSDKVGNTVKNLSTLLEPIMIILVGGMVAVFLLAIMLPFFGLGKVAGNL